MMRSKAYIKEKDGRYYISMINHSRLKRICALHHVHIELDTTGKHHQYYFVGTGTLGTFLRVMREHGIDITFI